MSFEAKITANISDFSTKLKVAVSESQKASNDIKAKFEGITSSISKVSLALGALSASITAVASKAFMMGSEFEDTLGATEQVFKGLNDEVKNWAKNLDSAYGIAEQKALEYANMMGTMLMNIGRVSEEEARKTSASLVELAGDLTAIFGRSTEEAITALTASLRGNMVALTKYGVAINDVMLKNKAFEMGLTDSTSEMSLQARQAATLALIYEQTGQAQGQAFREMDSASGVLRSISTEIKNLATSFGEVLLPIITPALTKLREVISYFGNMSEGAKKAIVVIGGLTVAFSTATLALGGVLKLLPTLIGGFTALTSPIGLAVGAVTALATAIIYFTTKTTEAKKSIKEFNKELAVEQSNVHSLISEYQNLNTTRERKLAIISELEGKYNVLLNDLTNEEGLLNNVTGAWNRVNLAIQNNLALKAKQQLIDTAGERFFKEQTKNLSKFKEQLDGLSEFDKNRIASKINKMFATSSADTNKTIRLAVQELENEQIFVGKKLRQSLQAMGSVANDLNVAKREASEMYDVYFTKEKYVLDDLVVTAQKASTEIETLGGDIKTLASELKKLDETGFKGLSGMFESLNKLEAPSINLNQKIKSFDELKKRIEETYILENGAQVKADIAYQKSVAIRAEANRLLAIAEKDRTEASIDLAVSAEKAAREAEKQAEALATKWRLASNEARIAKQTFEAVTGFSPENMSSAEIWNESVLDSFSKLKDGIANSLNEAKNEMDKFAQQAEAQASQIKQAFEGAIVNFASTLGSSLASGVGVVKSIGKSLLGALGGLMQQLGSMVIVVGKGVEAVQKSLMSLNGIPALVAGMALIAIGSAFSAGASKLGSSMGSGGGYAGGYSSGTTHTEIYKPAETEYRGMTGSVNFNIGIDELTGVLEVARNKSNRL